MKVLVAVVALLPLVGSAQVYKCTGADGKIAYSEAPCDPTAKSSKAVDIPLRTAQDPGQQARAMAESRDRAASDRRRAIELMLQDGRVNEARISARTPEERALVNDVAAAQRQAIKDAKKAEEERKLRESTAKWIKSATR